MRHFFTHSVDVGASLRNNSSRKSTDVRRITDEKPQLHKLWGQLLGLRLKRRREP
jgi:hypothetical protein